MKIYFWRFVHELLKIEDKNKNLEENMKAKQFLCKLFVSIFAICMLTGICVLKPAQTAVA